jgi:serine/threonine protein kinase
VILVTGESPFPSNLHAQAGRRAPLKKGVTMSAELLDLVERCLEVSPERRISLEQIRGHVWLA